MFHGLNLDLYPFFYYRICRAYFFVTAYREPHSIMTIHNFALIGAAGYIAPRHMKAIKAVNGTLKAAIDPSDSVGVIDSHFPEARFFTEFERFDRHIDKIRRRGDRIDFMSICSPNYLHDAHIRFALRSEAHAICEKPLVLNPWNISALSEVESSTGYKINTILQLRHHPAIIALKKQVEQNPDKIYDVDLTYITSRGRWYLVSWKGDLNKSGGIATNIGVHFYDMLNYIFGENTENIVHLHEATKAAGYLEFKRARVRWFLSVDKEDLPQAVQGKQPTYRSITVAGNEVEFSGGFNDLHTISYDAIIRGEGYGLNDVRPSIEMVSNIRNLKTTPNRGDIHPFAQKYI